MSAQPDQANRAGARCRVHAGAAGQHRRPLQRTRAHPDQAFRRRCRAAFADLAPRVATEIGKIHGVVDIQTASTTPMSGPATNFEVDPATRGAAWVHNAGSRGGCDGDSRWVDAPNPLISNGRPYTIRVRLGDDSRSRSRPWRDTVFNSSTGHTASLGSMTTGDAATASKRNSPRKPAAARRRHRAARRHGSGNGSARVRAACAVDASSRQCSRGVRRDL